MPVNFIYNTSEQNKVTVYENNNKSKRSEEVDNADKNEKEALCGEQDSCSKPGRQWRL